MNTRVDQIHKSVLLYVQLLNTYHSTGCYLIRHATRCRQGLALLRKARQLFQRKCFAGLSEAWWNGTENENVNGKSRRHCQNGRRSHK